ncbi:MAG: hypothetical protein ACREA3_07895 [Nitrosotalea sp.]
MKGLEKKMRKKYESFRKRNTEKGAACRAVQNWAEEWIVRTNGKLTISAENEVLKILDKLRLKSMQ